MDSFRSLLGRYIDLKDRDPPLLHCLLTCHPFYVFVSLRLCVIKHRIYLMLYYSVR